MTNDLETAPEGSAEAKHSWIAGVRSLRARYNQRLQHEHGWEVELQCPVCGTIAVPRFGGWTPSSTINFGNRATVYANLNCPRCGADVKEAAGTKLVELFADVSIPARNRRVTMLFIVLVVGATLLPLAWMFLCRLMGWRRFESPLLWTPLIALLSPTIMWFNWQIHSIRYRCDCGKPEYKFMGLLGRSYCYRCSTCGKLLRLRD